ncbi:nucleotidyltransferase family protein [Pontibacter sp. CAU 1760]
MRKKDATYQNITPYLLAELEVSEQDLHALEIDPLELAAIYYDYLGRQETLYDLARMVTSILKRAPHAYTVRYRVKEPLHLLKKIIRKKKEYPYRYLTPQNYLKYINDLVGVRILHLHKNEYHDIGEHIKQLWKLKRKPYAYVSRKKASKSLELTKQGYKLLVNPRGYTALHYIIKTQLGKQVYFVEIQTKTLFEEGWSEIDHQVYYPDHSHHELLELLLLLLHKFTYQADNIATYTQAIADELQQHRNASIKDCAATKARIRQQLDKLPVEAPEKQLFYNCLAKLKL